MALAVALSCDVDGRAAKFRLFDIKAMCSATSRTVETHEHKDCDGQPPDQRQAAKSDPTAKRMEETACGVPVNAAVQARHLTDFRR